jgi:beta-lactamase regulating signal transducer with metallopeptidase domain
MSAFWISALADAAVRATALLGIAAAITALPRNRSAALRHLVWALAIAGVLVMPLAGAILPGVSVPLPWTRAGAQPVTPDVGAAAAGARVRPPEPVAVGAGGGSGSAEAAGAGGRTASPPATWNRLLLAIWGAGAMAFAAWSLAGIRNTRRLAAQATPVTAPEWLDALREVGAQLEIRRSVRLVRSEGVAMPMTWGWRRPVVLVPASAAGWSSARRIVVLRHELAHVKRADVVTQSLAQWTCAVYWFNPALWFGAYRLRVERERACDDEVLRLGTRASDYANHLLDIARDCHVPGLNASAAVAMARRSQLEHRMRAILDPSIRRAAGRSATFLAAVVLVGAALTVAAVTPTMGTLPPAAMAGNPNPSAAATGRTGTSAAAVPTQGGSPSRRRFDDWHRVAEDVFATVVWHFSEARRRLGDTLAEARSQPVVESTEAMGPPAEPEGRDDTGADSDSPGTVGSRLVETFVDALTDADAEVRARAARALGRHRVHEAAAALRGALGDEDGDVRERAAWALGRIRDAAAVYGLLELLRDRVREVRERAAWALGRIRDPRATDGLIAALAPAGDDALHEVIEALARIGGERAMEALIQLMDADDPEVRRTVIEALSDGNWNALAEPPDPPAPPER